MVPSILPNTLRAITSRYSTKQLPRRVSGIPSVPGIHPSVLPSILPSIPPRTLAINSQFSQHFQSILKNVLANTLPNIFWGTFASNLPSTREAYSLAFPQAFSQALFRAFFRAVFRAIFRAFFRTPERLLVRAVRPHTKDCGGPTCGEGAGWHGSGRALAGGHFTAQKTIPGKPLLSGT